MAERSKATDCKFVREILHRFKSYCYHYKYLVYHFKTIKQVSLILAQDERLQYT